MTKTNHPGGPGIPLHWILFAAFLTSQLAIAGVGVALHPPEGGDPEVYTMLAAVFAMVSVMQLGLIGGLLPRFLSKTNYHTFMIIRFALAESIGIFGVVLAQIGAPLLWCGGFWLAAVVALLLGAPTEKDQEAFRRGGGPGAA